MTNNEVEKRLIHTSEMATTILVRNAYKECKDMIIKEGTLSATAAESYGPFTKCICDKLLNKDWREKQLKYGIYWTAPID